MTSELTADARQTRKRFLELVADVRPQLHRYCARMAGSIADGEDIVQEALARAYFSLPEHEEMPPLRPWLFRIAHNCAIDHLRRQDRSRETAVGLEPEAAGLNPESNTPGSPSPEDALAREDALHAALGHFMPLPPRQRSSVILMDVLGHSLEEVAALLEMSIQGVKAALHRGRSALRARGPDREPAVKPISAQLSRYAQLFNARDWDGIRAMLGEDVRLNVVNLTQRAGRRAVGNYVDNYSRITDWYFVPGWLEAREVIGVFSGPQEKIARYFIDIRFTQEQVATIRDYRYVPYIAQDARFVPGPT